MGRRRSKDDPRVAGWLAIDKPAGHTSHDVVATVRRGLGVRRVGHSGTLDPMATGLLLVGAGWVTRLLRFTGDCTKTYVGDITFGAATDSLDAEGRVVESSDVQVTPEAVRSALTDFVGVITQVPPMVSAVKVGGEALHEKARRGEEIEREPRTVTVHSLDLTRFEGRVARVEVSCSAGTYVRVLADDVGRALGTVAHLSMLRRTAICGHDVAEAVTLDTLVDRGREALRPPAGLLAHLPAVTVDASGAADARHGRPVEVPEAPDDRPFCIIGPDGGLVGVFSREPGHDRARGEVVAPDVSQAAAIGHDP